MEILVLHPGALGDIILALPALCLLKKRLPHARLTLAGNGDLLVPARGIADRLISLSAVPLHRLFGEVALPGDDFAYWRGFDRVLSWMGSGNPQFEGRLKEVVPAALVAGWKPGPGEPRHVSRIFMDTLRPWLTDVGEPEPPFIRPCEDDMVRARVWLEENGVDPGGQMAALHPGAGNVAKRWPLGRFRELSHTFLGQTALQLLTIEGPAEPGVGRALVEGLPARRCLLAANLPLGTIAALLRHCRFFIGNDSGISHLAAALGVASVVLFGPTEPGHWAPLGKRVRILRNSTGCMGCESAAERAHRCMDALTVPEVWDQVRRTAEIWSP